MAGFVMPIVTGLSIIRQQQEEAQRARMQQEFGYPNLASRRHEDLGETDEERNRREMGEGSDSDSDRYMRNMMIQMFLRSMLQKGMGPMSGGGI